VPDGDLSSRVETDQTRRGDLLAGELYGLVVTFEAASHTAARAALQALVRPGDKRPVRGRSQLKRFMLPPGGGVVERPRPMPAEARARLAECRARQRVQREAERYPLFKAELSGRALQILLRDFRPLTNRWKSILTSIPFYPAQEHYFSCERKDSRCCSSRGRPRRAGRVAWRILKDWVEAQLALVEAELVDVAEIMLPYMVTNDKRTVYQVMIDSRLALEGPR
jgi:hypothetical protein